MGTRKCLYGTICQPLNLKKANQESKLEIDQGSLRVEHIHANSKKNRTGPPTSPHAPKWASTSKTATWRVQKAMVDLACRMSEFPSEHGLRMCAVHMTLGSCVTLPHVLTKQSQSANTSHADVEACVESGQPHVGTNIRFVLDPQSCLASVWTRALLIGRAQACLAKVFLPQALIERGERAKVFANFDAMTVSQAHWTERFLELHTWEPARFT